MTMPMVLTAHGSADPRSSATTYAVADQIRRLRPGLDVRVAFCEKSIPNLLDVLSGLDGPAVVTPLLLASAYHARVDIPAIIAQAGVDVLQADTLGEDPLLVQVLRHRLSEVTIDADQGSTGVLVVAVGSSHTDANTGTATNMLTIIRTVIRTIFAINLPHRRRIEASPAINCNGRGRLGLMTNRVMITKPALVPGRILGDFG